MKKFQTHKMTKEAWHEAKAFEKENGFWNPAMTFVRLACGMDSDLAGNVTSLWSLTTCKSCLKVRKTDEKA